MIKIKEIITILQHFNNMLKSKILSKKELENANESIIELSNLEKEINKVINKLKINNLHDKEKIIYLLIHLHIHFIRYLGNLEEIYGLIRKMAGKFRKYYTKK